MVKSVSLQGVLEFVAAADSGSFSAAARALGVSVAHVSRQVAELERDLGLQLIQRTSRQSVLTDAGRSYHKSCRAVLDGLEEAREALHREQDELRGKIRISIGGHFAEDHLAPLLLRFGVRHPGVALDIEISNRNADLIEEGLDLAVRTGPLAASSLIARQLVGFPLVTLAAPDYLATRDQALTHPRALDPAWCLSLGHRRWTFRRGAKEHVFAPAGRIHSNSGGTLIEAALNSMGIVQLPGYYGRAEVKRGALVPILEAWTSSEPFEFYIVYPPQRRLAKRVRHLIDFLVQEVRTSTPAPSPTSSKTS